MSPSGSRLPCTGIISPITDTAAVLSLLSYERASETDVSKDEDFSLPEIMSSVLNHVDDSKEDDSEISGKLPCLPLRQALALANYCDTLMV